MSSPKPISRLLHTLLGTLVVMVAGCANMQMGSPEAKTVATGSAGGANTQNANAQLEKCDGPLGTLAVVEDANAPWYGILTRQYQLGSTVPVLKLLVQQSNCFVVVERGRAMGSMMQERALEQAGELRSNSSFGRGQIASADYSLSPSITFSNQDAGGLGATIGGFLGPVGSWIGGNVKAKEASTLLTLVDNRSSVQVAAAEGSARNVDIGAMGGLFGGGGWGTARGYSNTAEGKVIVAAFTDSLNNIVKSARNYRVQEVKGGLGTGGHLKVQK
jgi:curli biogenesis system outer membrane secretion channel CsgG